MSLVGKASKYGSLVSPKDFAGLRLWLDAADSTTISLSGSNVTQWRDKSGGSNHSTGLTNSPTWAASSINGRPAVSVNSSGIYGSFGSSGSTPITSKDLHVFLVVARTATSGDAYSRYLLLDDGVTNGFNASNGTSLMMNGFDELAWQRNGVRGRGQALGSVASVINAYDLGTANSISKTGGSFLDVSHNSTSSFNIKYWRFGVDGLANNIDWITNSFIGELLVYESALAPTSYRAIESYLTQKWGTTQLPTTHPYRTALPSMRRFQPVPDLSGCTLWLDAADSTTLVYTGSNITQWSDKSGLGNHAVQATTSNAPTYELDSGYPGIRFTRANGEHLGCPPVVNSTQLAIYIVYRTTTTSGNNQNVFVDFKQTSGAGLNYIQHVILNGWRFTRYCYAESPATFRDSDLVAATTSRVLFALVDGSNTPTSRNFYLTGSSMTNNFNNGGASNIAQDTRLTLGAVRFDGAVTTSSTLDGYIHEVLVFVNEPSTLQRQTVEAYLTNKWGLRDSLPSTHGLKSSLPLVPIFTPTQFPGCVLWLDAADTGSIQRTDSTLTAWADKSPNGRTVTLTGTHTWSSNAVSTSASRNSYLSVNLNVQKAAAPSLSVFIVYKWLGFGSNVDQVLWGCDVPNGNSRVQMLSFPVFSSSAYGLGGGQGVGSLALSDLNTSNPMLYAVSMTLGGSSRAVLNGTEKVTYVEGTPNLTSYDPWNTLYFGTGHLGASSFNAYVAFNEIIFYTSNLSTTDRQQVEGYLAWKWNLQQSLPSAHPNKAFKS